MCDHCFALLYNRDGISRYKLYEELGWISALAYAINVSTNR